MAGNENRRVLLVDDEPDVLLTFRMTLESAGYSVDAYAEPERALSNFKPGFYSIVLTDIKMPRMNGFDLARAIWQKDENTRRYCIICV